MLGSLNKTQREAVQSEDGPLLILAGAGSGKTRVLCSRVSYLVLEKGVPASSIVALTFTNKAATEMRQRLEGQIGKASRDVFLGTFHGLGLRILNKEAGAIGLKRNITVYNDDDQLKLAKAVLQDLGINEKVVSPRAMLKRIDDAKNEAILPDDYLKHFDDFLAERVYKAYSLYQKRLLEMNCADFGDLLCGPISIFKRHSNLLLEYQERTGHLLVDEYQDTNRAQYMLSNLLIGKTRNIFAVGDPDQSIYSWRGADIRNILDFNKDYPEASVVRLEQNYRSTKTILLAANSVIRNNADRPEKNLWTENPEGPAIVHEEAEDERAEAASVIRRIRDIMSKGKGLSLRDIAIFYRTNAQSRVFEEGLIREGLPYVIVGGVRFYDRKEIRDALAYLRVVSNPDDSMSLQRIINTPARGVGEMTISKMLLFAEEARTSLYEAFRTSVAKGLLNKHGLNSLFGAIDEFASNMGNVPLSELCLRLLEGAGYMDMLHGEDDGVERVENIFELISAIKDFESIAEGGASLADFLNHVSLISDIDSYKDGLDRITLMTLHSAKGLEFKAVFMTGMEDGLFPHSRSLNDPGSLEEERRLCYVGMTRAEELLFLSCSRTRTSYGEARQSMASRFISEIPTELLSDHGQSKAHAKGVYEINEPVYTNEDSQQEAHSGYATARLKRGMKVVHPSFGIGVVRELSGGPEDLKATVDFSSIGRKRLALRYTTLEPLL